MTLIKSKMARAYVNYGRWIADCPENCGGALEIVDHKGNAMPVFACQECLVISYIDWPDDAEEIWNALQERPHDKNKNWFPSGHELALRSNCPHGQTAKQLREEAYFHGVDNT